MPLEVALTFSREFAKGKKYVNTVVSEAGWSETKTKTKTSPPEDKDKAKAGRVEARPRPDIPIQGRPRPESQEKASHGQILYYLVTKATDFRGTINKCHFFAQ